MDKEDWSILIGISVLIVSSIGVYITYQTYSVVEPEEDISFIVFDVSEETGQSISLDFSRLGGELGYGKRIIEEETYYTARILMTNRGKRAHNVLLTFSCENIDFYGITKSVPSDSDFEIRYVCDWGTELYFPEVDEINLPNWVIIFRVNNDIKEFNCKMEYVSDDVGQKTEHVVINLC